MIDLELVKESESISLKLKENIGTGTGDYNDLENKPSINGVELQGALTTEDLGIESESIDVQVNGTSIVNDGVANIPIMTHEKMGVAKYWNAYGIQANDEGYLQMLKAANDNIDKRDSNYRAIVPTNFDYALKQGMCDGKGVEWTSEEKTMAKKRVGVGEYRTLFETTLTEPVGSVVFNTDMDGNRFEVEEVIIILENCKVENTRIRIVDTTNKHEDFVNIYYSVAKTDKVYKYIFEIGQQIDGTHRVEIHFSSNTGTLYENVSTAPFTVYSKRNVKYLTRLQIDNNGGNFSAGTRIWVGGR